MTREGKPNPSPQFCSPRSPDVIPPFTQPWLKCIGSIQNGTQIIWEVVFSYDPGGNLTPETIKAFWDGGNQQASEPKGEQKSAAKMRMFTNKSRRHTQHSLDSHDNSLTQITAIKWDSYPLHYNSNSVCQLAGPGRLRDRKSERSQHVPTASKRSMDFEIPRVWDKPTGGKGNYHSHHSHRRHRRRPPPPVLGVHASHPPAYRTLKWTNQYSRRGAANCH